MEQAGEEAIHILTIGTSITSVQCHYKHLKDLGNLEKNFYPPQIVCAGPEKYLILDLQIDRICPQVTLSVTYDLNINLKIAFGAL